MNEREWETMHWFFIGASTTLLALGHLWAALVGFLVAGLIVLALYFWQKSDD